MGSLVHRPLSQAVTQSLAQTAVLVCRGASEEQTVALVARLCGRGLDVSLKKKIALLVSARRDAQLRIAAWLSGNNNNNNASSNSDAAVLRRLVRFVTAPRPAGGCGVAVGAAGDCVGELLVVGDADWPQLWLNALANKLLLDRADLSMIQRHLGDSVAFYFAFLNYFVLALVPISALGVVCHLFLPQYSSLYAFAVSLWSIVFMVSWKRQEYLLADAWSCTDASIHAKKRSEFVPDRNIRDPLTGEIRFFFSPWKRWIVHFALTFPHHFGITRLDNAEYADDHTASLTRKSFILTFLLTHLSLLLVGAVYIPLSDKILPFLSALGIPHLDLSLETQANLLSPASLQERVAYFCLTGQVVNQVVEVVIPAVTSWWSKRSIQKQITKNAAVQKSNNENSEHKNGWEKSNEDIETIEQKLQKRINHALSLPVYSLYDDFAELANQFALISMFSVSWPLAPLCFLINNFIELRTDAFKICTSVRRPIPHQASNIGPWNSIFSFLSLFGTLSTTLLTSLYQNWDTKTPASIQTIPNLSFYLLLLIASEHIHILASRAIEAGFNALFQPIQEQSEQSREKRFQEWKAREKMLKVMIEEEEGGVGMEERVEQVLEIVGRVFP
ncbi:calcium-activated chloride channel-domain-containing protein [Obelidium mucronatum]|nr:calcium-activated chloride channel-domain-containing protein [Obelidium mucronatum]